MNILILSTHMNTGGITEYIFKLARGLSSKHRLYVVTGGGALVDEMTSLGVAHTLMNIYTKSELSPKIYFAIGPLLKLIKENNIDVIHCQTRVTQVLGFFLSKLSGKPYVATCHGFYKKRLVRRIFPCWGKYTIAISEAVRDQLIDDFGVRPERVILVHHGLRASRFPFADEATRKAKREELHVNNRVVIGIIARLSKEKGHSVLLKAMRRIIEKVPNALLLIVGTGRIEQELKMLAQNLKLEDHVWFHDVVHFTPEILPVLDVFAMPSLQEGLGFSMMEAQSVGVPVVASRVGGIPDVIIDGKTGLLVAPGNVDSLSEAIIQLLTNKKMADDIRHAARQRIESEFSLEKMIEKTAAVYEKAVSAP